MPLQFPEVLLSLLAAGGSSTVLVLIVLIMIFAPLIYIVVLSKGPAADRLVKIIEACRQRRPSMTRK